MGKFDIPVKNATWNEVKNLKSCVYVMGNTYMKGFLKVGYTKVISNGAVLVILLYV